MNQARDHYQARMRRVLDHIDRHLDDDLGLEALSGVAAFSPHHFHRQFAATFGVSAYRYVQLVRLRRASQRLAFRPDQSVTEIALDAGYDAPDAFARAFRRRLGQSPTAFRAAPDWDASAAAFAPLEDARREGGRAPMTAEVTVETAASIPVALMEHRGDPRWIGETIRRFIAWRKAHGLSPRNSATYTVFHSDPRTTLPADFRLHLCVGVDQPVTRPGEGVEAGVIPGGRRARLRVTGGSDAIEAGALALYRDWLPASSEAARDFPLHCRRVNLFPDVPEHEAVTDLYLPLE